MRQLFLSITVSFCTLLATGQTFSLTDTVVKENDVYTTYQIGHQLGKWQLLEDCFPLLDSIAFFMENNKDVEVEIVSHVDTRWKTTWYSDLPQKRAQEIVDYLIEKGISSERLVAWGCYGTDPIISEEEIDKMKSEVEIEEAHRINRRTEFRILEVKKID